MVVSILLFCLNTQKRSRKNMQLNPLHFGGRKLRGKYKGKCPYVYVKKKSHIDIVELFGDCKMEKGIFK